MPRMITTGRLAPSPTGHLHLGHAFAFLVAWWSARSQQGRVVLRLEDLDVTRSSDRYCLEAIEDLSWLGLDWDEPPHVQSERTKALQTKAFQLADQGRAYACTCTRGEIRRAQQSLLACPEPELLEARGAPQQGTKEAPYPGTCRNRYQNLRGAEAGGSSAGLRFLTPAGPVCFEDQIQGPQSFDVAAQVGDFPILRRDKAPAYQLAVVVDDTLDGVNEVIRGRDLLESTARQLLLLEALGFPPPRYAHLPLICDSQGRRFAKRHDDLSLRRLREQGVSPHQIATWAAIAAGQVESLEQASPAPAGSYIARFRISTVPQADILLPEAPESLFPAL